MGVLAEGAACRTTRLPHRDIPAAVGDLDDAALASHIETKLALAEDQSTPPTEPAVYLLAEDVIGIDQAGWNRWVNVLLHVRDREKAGSVEQVVRVGRGEKEVKISAWTYSHLGTITRLPDGDLKRTAVDDGGRYRIIVTFPNLQDDMVVGFSFAGTTPGIEPAHGQFRLPRNHYTVDRAIRVRSELRTSYRFELENMRRGVLRDDLEVVDGVTVDTRLRVLGLEVDSGCPFNLPFQQRVPTLNFMLRGRYIEGVRGGWFYIYSWGQAASEFAGYLEHYLDEDRIAKRTARALTKDGTGHVGDLRTLMDYVSDKIIIIADDEIRTRAPSPDQTLTSRTGTELDCMLLLYAMARSRDVPVELLFTRTGDDGGIDLEYPSFAQFHTAVLRLEGAPDVYASIQPGSSTLGELPTNLWGVDAALIREHAFESGKKEFSRAQNLADLKKRMLSLKTCDLLKLPGDPDTVPESGIEETIQCGSAGESTVLTVVSWGEPSVAADVAAPSGEDFQEYVNRRFEAIDTSGQCNGARPDSSRTGCTTIRGSVQLEMVSPQAAGDVWILTPTKVFGKPFFSDWSKDRCNCFHVAGHVSFCYEWRHRLPEGWAEISAVRPMVVKNKLMSYRADVFVEAGDIVVRRSIRLNPFTKFAPRLDQLDKVLKRITAFETTPLVIERSTAQS